MMKTYALDIRHQGEHVLDGTKIDLRQLAKAAARLLGTYKMRERSRRELAQLDPHLLKDVGIDPLDAAAEARKPFWKP
jgi:uncharacterized protein YjiS (DUF1127 family)